MPLTKIQTEILLLLASKRDPESYVAGATPLNQNALRYSGDIDIFHDEEERVLAAASEDTQTLESAGYSVRWLRQFPTIQSAEISRADLSTRIEWVADSDFRFFPTMQDNVFGYVLHPVDLAMNKVMAAAGRRAIRDLIDLMTIHETILPLGAVVWAAVEKSPGFTPEGLIAEIRRNSHYSSPEWKSLQTTTPLEPTIVMPKFRAFLKEADEFVARMPSEMAGRVFLLDGKILQPEPDRLGDYQTHVGRRRGLWPSSPEITTAMLERYQQKP